MGVYLLNPGDGRDVQRFDSQDEANAAYDRAKANDSFASLYFCYGGEAYGRPELMRLVDGRFYQLDADDLSRTPIKVLDAAKAVR